MTTKRSAAAATIFSRRWAPPPPLISQPSGVTWSVPSIAMSRRFSSLNSSTGMPSSRACSSVATEVATQRMPLEPAGGDRRQQVGDGRAGAEADRHPVLDQLRRRLGGDPLLVVGSPPARDSMLAWRWTHASGLREKTASRGRSRLAASGRSVGRDPEADICIDDEAVSWNHLEIESRGGRADGDRPRQPQRHRAERRAARPSAPPPRWRRADRRRPPARNLGPRPRPGGGRPLPRASPRSLSPRRSGRPRRPSSPPTAARVPSPAVPRRGRRSPRRSTSASAPPSDASTRSPPSSTSPATPAASAPA